MFFGLLVHETLHVLLQCWQIQALHRKASPSFRSSSLQERSWRQPCVACPNQSHPTHPIELHTIYNRIVRRRKWRRKRRKRRKRINDYLCHIISCCSNNTSVDLFDGQLDSSAATNNLWRRNNVLVKVFEDIGASLRLLNATNRNALRKRRINTCFAIRASRSNGSITK